MKSVGSFASVQNGDELAVGLGTNPHESFVHGGERFRAEIVDLLQVAEFMDDGIKCSVQFGKGKVNVGLHRHGPGGWLWVEILGWMECVSFLNSHFRLLSR